MTLGQIATKVRSLTNTDVNSYTDTNLLIDINIWLQKIASMIFDSQDDSDFDDARRTDYPIQTTPMIAGQRDYVIGVSEQTLKLKRIDISYDGINFYRAEPFDDGAVDMGMGNDTLTDQNFIKTAPKYDVKFGSYWIYPLPSASDVAAGGVIRSEWQRGFINFATSDYTSVLTDSTVIPGFDEPFHPILAYGPAFEYSASKQLPQLQEIQPQLADYEQRMRIAYGKKDLDTRLSLAPFYQNNYGR